MAVKSNARWEPLRRLAFGAIDAAFTAIGTPLVFPARHLTITNSTNGTVVFSFDGDNTNIQLLAGTVRNVDIGTNRSATSDDLAIKAGTTVYVATAAVLASGEVTVEAMYIG